jgi:hypothetical protein
MRAVGTLRLAACAAVPAMLAIAASAIAADRSAPSGAAAAADRCPERSAFLVQVAASTLCISVDDAAEAPAQRVLQEWIERSARIVADYYTVFPAARVVLRIRGAPGSGVRGGRTTNESELVIQATVGRDTGAAELADDWVLVHEMVHLALPELGRRHNWLAEGLATYVEGVARAQAGNRAIADVWAEYRRSMPRGLPEPGEGGMDETPTWGRTYWGGALYCLQVDVAMREQTKNRIGLQRALQAILKETGGYRTDRDIDEVLRVGDAATGTHVLEDLYGQIKTTPMTPDLEQLWARLGVPQDPAVQPFDDQAPLAAIRIAITRKP